MNVQALSELTIRGSPATGAGSVQPTHSTERKPIDVAGEAMRPSVENARQERQPNADEMRQAMEAVNGFLRANDSHIQFALHEKMKQLMVQVIDDRTQEVIKTFPPKELLDLAAKIRELVGALLDKKG